MKNFLKVLAIIALVVVIGFSIAACGGDNGGGGPGGPVPRTVTYSGTTSNGDLYTLTIIENITNPNRAVLDDPMAGDNFEFTWKQASDNSTKTSRGTVKEVSGDEFTMLPSNAADEDTTFNATVTDGGLSYMSGEFTWTDGETWTGSGTLTPVKTAVTWTGLSANGTANFVTTTALTLTFDKDPVSLAIGNVTVTGATKGALSGSGTTRTLTISDITVAQGANVTVTLTNPAGYTITPVSKTVAINRAGGSGGTVIAVTAGIWHNAAIKSDGTLWAWGSNGGGQLGIGTSDFDDHLTPVQIGAATWASVSANANYTVAIKTDGTLWAWGMNDYGQLGIGTSDDDFHPNPVRIGAETNWASVSTSGISSVAIRTDGTLWAWGYNRGLLGDGTEEDRYSPVQIGTGYAFVETDSGFTAAIKSDGTLWAWGNGALIGDGTTEDRSSPVKIGTATWTSVSSVSHIAAIKSDGTLWAWGHNEDGQLGNGKSGAYEYESSPVQIGTDTNWKSVSVGDDYTVAIKTDGTLWTWGSNDYGQLGIGTSGEETGRNSPVQIGTGYASVSAGRAHTLAIKTDGTLWAWGRGPLGDGTTQRTIPVRIDF